MLNLFSTASLNQSVSNGITGSEAPAIEADGGEIDITGSSFTELLNTETSMAKMLEELKALLSAEDFTTLEGLLAEGQALPLAEIVAALRQQLSDATVEQSALQTLKLSDVLPDWVVATEEATEQVAALLAAEMIDDAVEQAVTPLITGQTAVPIAISKIAIPMSVITDQAVVKAVNGKSTQPIVTGPVAVSSNIEGDTAGLSSNMGGSSANLDRQSSIEQFQMTAAMATKIAQKIPANNLFRATEAGLTSVNNIAVAPSLASQNTAQAVAANQLNTLPIHIPMGAKGWDQAMGERMLWMVGRQMQGAEVRITPPQLGPIDIRISIQNDQAKVTFAAQHGVVREALEASIPRLREMLSENNLQLVNIDVNQRNNSEQRASHFSNQPSSGEQDSEGHEIEEDESIGSRMLTIQSDGLVDDFA